MKVNAARVWMGGIAGGVAWTAWSFFIGMRQAPYYDAMQKQGLVFERSSLSIFCRALDWIDLCDVNSDRVSCTRGVAPRPDRVPRRL